MAKIRLRGSGRRFDGEGGELWRRRRLRTMSVSKPETVPRVIERLLVRGVNWLGDAVMSTPALLRLREAAPRAQVTLLTHAKLAELWTAHPAVDSVMTFADGDTIWSVSRKLRE